MKTLYSILRRHGFYVVMQINHAIYEKANVFSKISLFCVRTIFLSICTKGLQCINKETQILVALTLCER